MRIVIRVGSGPRRGYGHVVRALRLARAVDARVWLSADGPVPPHGHPVRILGRGIRALDHLQPDLLVLDTPVQADGLQWLRAARRRGLATASIHDRGIAPLASDLAFDGSLAARGPVRGARRSLVGSRYMIVDPAVRRTGHQPQGRRVVISLGGGSRRALAAATAARIAKHCPDTEIVIAAGFHDVAAARRSGAVRWVGPQPSLVPLLASASVAVVAGGITLYEAAALGVPPVAVPVVEAQRPTVTAFAAAGAAVSSPTGDPAGIADAVLALMARPALCRELSARGRTLVDGRGVERVARELVRLGGGR